MTELLAASHDSIVYRRRRVLRVTPSFLVELLKPGRRCFDVLQGLPKDASFVYSYIDHSSQAVLCLVLESAEYALVGLLDAPDADHIVHVNHLPCLCRQQEQGDDGTD